MRNVTKGSTISKIKKHDTELRAFAYGLVQTYDVDRDGDDFWTAYSFGDGSFADVNVWIESSRGKRLMLCVAAYPVTKDGDLVTDEFRVLYKQSLTAKYKTQEGDPF